MRIIHFLHIGKNAGTQIKHLASQINSNNENCRIESHEHRVILADLPPNSEYFFSIRQPDARFKSAFYSRKRKGQPRLYAEWSRHEREMFSIFEHANDLAEALFENSPKGYLAFCAMKTSIHFTTQYDWFTRNGFFLKFHPPVAILRQEYLSKDIAVLTSKLELKKPVSVTEDHILSHQNNYEGIPSLSGKARKNLRAWYVQDFQFYKYCEAWIESKRSNPLTTV